MPAELSAEISQSVDIPVIGIGAGAGCDGQVLVIYDLLGMNPDFSPKFVKKYLDLGVLSCEARQPLQRRGEARHVPRAGAQLHCGAGAREGGAGAAALLEREMSLAVIATAHDFRRACQEARRDAELALVPTMGCLHEGHQSLIRAAAQRAPTVAVTIFVNPAQFGPGEDLSRYPRDLDGDLRKCEEAGAAFVFVPRGPEEIYPTGFQTYVEPGPLAGPLCGEKRPGHFRGVCTVVAKLFALSRADSAFFGEKDYQQLAVIRRMNADLNLGVEVIGRPNRARERRPRSLLAQRLSLPRGARAGHRPVEGAEGGSRFVQGGRGPPDRSRAGAPEARRRRGADRLRGDPRSPRAPAPAEGRPDFPVVPRRVPG